MLTDVGGGRLPPVAQPPSLPYTGTMQLPVLPSNQTLAEELVRLLAWRGPVRGEEISDALGE
jgi:hypothetical protein